MIDKKEVAAYFDRLASAWDADMVRNERAIQAILDAADVQDGVSVLDAGCGTGVLIGDYLKRGASRVHGVDLSSEMAALAAKKFAADPRVSFACGDAAELAYDGMFDRVIVYNAFPHFADPEAFFARAAANLTAQGRLTVAHGMSREALLKHHSGGASRVSFALPLAEEFSERMQPWFDVDVVASDAEKYIVSGVKK